MAFSLTPFGRGGVVLRAHQGKTLELDAIRQHAPAIFAKNKHASRSDRYAYIPTAGVLGAMMRENFLPVEIRQGGSRDESKRGYTKHLIRFRPPGVVAVVDGTFPEIAVLNAHDGTSSYKVFSAWFRFVCSNGLYVSEQAGPSLVVPHRGQVYGVVEASYKVAEELPKQAQQIERFRKVQLTEQEAVDFARAAIALRWESGVQPEQVLQPRRPEDAGASLWAVFNRLQESITGGGIVIAGPTTRRRFLVRQSRAVHAVQQNIRLNQALWSLMVQMAEAKEGQKSIESQPVTQM
jgi:hypothetical protein